MNWWSEQALPPCETSRLAAADRQATLTKPPGSLGRLEALALDFAAWQGNPLPEINRIQICVFAADHGVVQEGVSAFPQAVTVEMIRNFSRGGAAISVLARNNDAAFKVVNLGTASLAPDFPGVTNLQLASGSANLCREAAMTTQLLDAALAAGRAQISLGELFVGGEMGIGNTTATAALTSCLLDLPASVTVGRGTGVDDAGLELKISTVERALALHKKSCEEPYEALRRLGGLEIAALVGAYIGAAQQGVPSVVDGYICTAAALLATRLNPSVRAWLLFSHRSVEPGHQHLLQALQAEPLVDMGMRLGEGSGAALVIPLLRSACALHSEMATFDEAGVSENEREGSDS